MMDSSNETHSLINLEPQNKLNYISIVNTEPVKVDSSQQPLRKLQSNGVQESCLFSDSYDEDEPKPRIRKRNPANWKQNVRKRNKNKGLEYVKANGEVCEKKKLGPPCTCKEKCYLKIGMDACEKIFQNFWNLGDHALQNAYIAGCVRIFLPKCSYRRDGIPSRRFFSRNFYVTVNGVDTEVCKQAFLNMHAISNGRLDRLLRKKQEIGNTGFDQRGKHNNKVNKISEEKIKLVHRHIDLVRRKAGYTGKRKSKKVEILTGSLNIRTLYRSYKEELLAKGFEPVCEYRYRKIFHTDFNLVFGKSVVPNTGGDLSHVQQQQQHQTGFPHLATQNRTEADDKVTNKGAANAKKGEAFPNLTLQDLNVDEQLNTNLKGAKQVGLYTQLEVPEANQLREPDSNYALRQEIFRLEYPSSYNSPQQGWIFSSQN